MKPDDPLDFPPLGHPNLTNSDSNQAAACTTPATNPTWNLASQMKKMVCILHNDIINKRFFVERIDYVTITYFRLLNKRSQQCPRL